MRHKPTDRRDVNGRNNRQAAWSAVAIVMMAGGSAAIAQSGKSAHPPVNTGLTPDVFASTAGQSFPQNDRLEVVQ